MTPSLAIHIKFIKRTKAPFFSLKSLANLCCPILFFCKDAEFILIPECTLVFHFQVFHNCILPQPPLGKHDLVRESGGIYSCLSQAKLRQVGSLGLVGQLSCCKLPTSLPGGESRWEAKGKEQNKRLAETKVILDPALTLRAHTGALLQHLRRLQSRPLIAIR